MDPDPLSINILSVLLNPFEVVFIIILVLLGAAMLFFVVQLEEYLMNINANELPKLEKEQPIIFNKIDHLYRKTNRLSISFLFAKLFLIALLSIALVTLTNNYISYSWLGIIVVITLVLLIYTIAYLFIKPNLKIIKSSLPFSTSLLKLSAYATNIFTQKAAPRSLEDISLKEIKEVLPQDEKPVSPANLNLYRQILRFDKLKVHQVMRPKSEIQGIKTNYNFQEVLRKVKVSPFSRLPVYKGNLSNVLGIIHCKDLLPHTTKQTFDWQQFIRTVHFVEQTDNVQEVLRQFQKSKSHMALVKDKSNRLMGLVTLEDITEEIIGEIDDE